MLKKMTLLTLLITIGILFTGCGSEDDVKFTPQNTLIVGNTSFNGDFYTGWSNSVYDENIRNLVFGRGLLATDKDGITTKNYMTENYEQSSENDKVFIFTLKDNIKFSDGTILNADDVLFTYNFYMDEKLKDAGASSTLNEYLESVEKIDDKTIKFTLKELFYTLKTTLFDLNIIKNEIADEASEAGKTPQQYVKENISAPIGSGPYKIHEYKETQYIKLTKNEHFQGDLYGKVPNIQNVIVKVVADETEVDELITKNIDLLAGVTTEEKIDTIKENSEFTYNNYLRHGYGHLTFHNDFDVVANKSVRQAIAYTIDRNMFIQTFLGKYGLATQGPYSTHYWMIDDAWVDENLIKYEPNVDKVNEIMTTDGWVKNADGIWEKNGETTEISIAVPMQNWADSLNLVLANTKDTYGIKFNVEMIDFSVLLNHYYGFGAGLSANDRKYHMFSLATTLPVEFDGYINWHSDKVEPFAQATSTSTARLINARNDELLIIMRNTQDAEVYKNAYRDWVKLMNEEMPLIPMYSNDYYDLYNKKVINLNTNPMWTWAMAVVEANIE